MEFHNLRFHRNLLPVHVQQLCALLQRPSARALRLKPRQQHGISRIGQPLRQMMQEDRKSTRLNSSHGYISYAVFCLQKKIIKDQGNDWTMENNAPIDP